MPMRILLAAIGAIAFACVGLICMVWPRELQRYILTFERRTSWNPFLPLMRTEAYVVQLRLVGFLALVAAVVVAVGVVFGEP